MKSGFWPHPTVIAENNFVYKSLSNWSLNIAIGCEHGCRFCFVPDTSTNRMGNRLKQFNVQDPDAEWGGYVFLRYWDDAAFKQSLVAADRTPAKDLAPDGNRAVMLCTTTDPYQTIINSNPDYQKALNAMRSFTVRRALTLIRDESRLNVRILTRSPLAKLDFELMKTLGHRLLFGMSIPTLRNDLARVYEPKAPAPSQRIETLMAAKAAGLNVYAAVAPVYPECDEADMENTLIALKELDPVTIFMEPINIRAENVKRISDHASELGMTLQTEVFNTPQTWVSYALQQLTSFERLALKHGLLRKLHLWPDKALGSQHVTHHTDRLKEWVSAASYTSWLDSHWTKISAWPGPVANPVTATDRCDHKFIDSKSCLKCGWTP